MVFHNPNSPSLLEDVLARIESELDAFEVEPVTAGQDSTEPSGDTETVADQPGR